MPPVIFAYVTHPDAAGAADLGRSMIDRKLAACVNIFPGMHTIYRWQGAIESGSEVAMIVKTTEAQFESLRTFIHARHPYECPCIVALPVTEGDPGYLDWIVQSCA